MPETHDDYPLAEVLDNGDLIHHARSTALFGSRIETRCGMRGRKTGRDGGIYCPRCLTLERERAEADAHEGHGGDVAAKQLRATVTRTKAPAYLAMSDEELTAACCDHEEVDRLREQLAAATAELGRVNKRADFLDDALNGMRQQAIEAVKERNEATARAKKAEALVAELRTNRDHCVAREITAKIEARQLRARLAELGKPEVEQRLISPSGLVYEPTLRDLENQDYWLPGVRLEERQVYPTPWRVAADAAQDGLSAKEADDKARAKFAAEMDQLWKWDPTGARWIEHTLSERTAQQPGDDTTEGR